MNAAKQRAGGMAMVVATGLAVNLWAVPASAQAPDRSQRPALSEVPDLELPEPRRFDLSNGMSVVLVQKREVPLVQLNLLVRAGNVRELPDELGLADLTADMMDEGAGGRSALDLADAFETLGARFSTRSSRHAATVALRVPTARLDAALDLMADVVLRPDFPEPELERLRQDRITALIRRHDEPNVIASSLFDRLLYGEDHPYGRSALGDEASIESFTVDDVRGFHDRHYRPNNTTAVVVGDIDEAAARAALERAFVSWEAGDSQAQPLPEPAVVRGRVIHLVDKPGAAQSIIVMGYPTLPRTTSAYHAIEVMNVVLGGAFTSRLNQNLREDKGYSYGARSAFGWAPIASPFSASAAVQTDVTAPALTEFLNELNGMHEPLPDEEVSRARNFLAMRYPAGFQSIAEIAGKLAELLQYDLPPSYFNDYTDDVLAVGGTDVESAARSWINADDLVIVVVGDRERIEESMRALGLGEVRLLEVTDVLGPVPTRAGT